MLPAVNSLETSSSCRSTSIEPSGAAKRRGFSDLPRCDEGHFDAVYSAIQLQGPVLVARLDGDQADTVCRDVQGMWRVRTPVNLAADLIPRYR